MVLNFQQAGNFAQQFGVKCLVYGAPGTGKTPICDTAPRPIICASEPGLLSMKGSPTMTCMAEDPATIAEFYQWLNGSQEIQNFDTICIDSISQQAEIILSAELKKNKDGRKAYGEMSRKMMEYLNQLYYTRSKHIYLVAKEAKEEVEGIQKYRPYFPGQDLSIKVPHLFDEVLQLTKTQIPGVGVQTAFRTNGGFTAIARDRSGKLAEFEPPHLTNLFNKIIT